MKSLFKINARCLQEIEKEPVETKERWKVGNKGREKKEKAN